MTPFGIPLSLIYFRLATWHERERERERGRGRGSGRTYSFIPVGRYAGVGKPWGELAPDYYLADFLTSWGDSDSETEGVA